MSLFSSLHIPFHPGTGASDARCSRMPWISATTVSPGAPQQACPSDENRHPQIDHPSRELFTRWEHGADSRPPISRALAPTIGTRAIHPSSGPLISPLGVLILRQRARGGEPTRVRPPEPTRPTTPYEICHHPLSHPLRGHPGRATDRAIAVATAPTTHPAKAAAPNAAASPPSNRPH